jgi:drug/metabolite transporter (DMT)-like permease
MRMLAILLVIIGVISLVWGGITYIKDRDTVDLGVVKVVTEDKDRISIPPTLGVIALVAGGVLFVVSSRKTSKLST